MKKGRSGSIVCLILLTGVLVFGFGCQKASDLEKAERVAQKAERHCLVTNSMKTPVQLKYEITAVGD